MDDHELDTLVREAERPGAVAPSAALRDAQLALLEEVVAVRPRRRLSASVGVLAAAAAVALVVGGGALVKTSRSAQPVPIAPATRTAASPLPYSAAAVRQAAASPRLLLDAPGWSVANLGMDRDGGSIDFHADGSGRHLEATWYPASSYEQRRDDRAHVSAVEQIPVLGVTARMVTYERGDYAVMLPPSRGIFLEIRSRGLADVAAYRALLAQLRQVPTRVWLDSLPSTVVVPRTGDEQVATMLAGVPLPPRFDLADATPQAAEDSYQTGAYVSGAVVCAWLKEWTTADAAGDAVSKDRAVAALATSRQWPVLRKMDVEGDYPEVVWEYADQVAHGAAPTGYRQGLGCRS